METIIKIMDEMWDEAYQLDSVDSTKVIEIQNYLLNGFIALKTALEHCVPKKEYIPKKYLTALGQKTMDKEKLIKAVPF